METLKYVILGDRSVGKTSLILKQSTGNFPGEYTPKCCTSQMSILRYKHKKIGIHLIDTESTNRSVDDLHPSLFIICFSLTDYQSFQNIQKKYLPLLKSISNSIPILVVGTKLDLVKSKKKKQFLTKQKRIKILKKYGINNYAECSSLKNKHIKKVFQKSISIIKHFSQKNLNTKTVVRQNLLKRKESENFKQFGFLDTKLANNNQKYFSSSLLKFVK
ncbi:rho family gtpase [Anaeramoeba flamelloides]|uniref:Rho family gtpase n=1 Tax=Anaeramoeba flamelloides TaxID=1746091 RepID=A0ABQ8X137_9EUKA|nr:rho family gtpase [Anaeramoeba flamelloides]